VRGKVKGKQGRSGDGDREVDERENRSRRNGDSGRGERREGIGRVVNWRWQATEGRGEGKG
jgi:hypothetical protein